MQRQIHCNRVCPMERGSSEYLQGSSINVEVVVAGIGVAMVRDKAKMSWEFQKFQLGTAEYTLKSAWYNARWRVQ